MTTFSCNRPVLRLTLALAILASFVLASAPAGHAQSPQDKRAKKVHIRLQKYRSGSYLHLVLRNSTNEYGALDTLSDASFSFKNSDTNAVSTISYSDVNRIGTDREPIGEGSEPAHHYFRTRTLIIAGVLVAGAAVAAVEVR